MMGGSQLKLPDKAIRMNEKGEDEVIPGLFAVGEIA